MKKLKNAKGITLIALVITIIILLILAGITLNTLWGEGGIINQAERTKIMNELATYKEQLDLFVKEKTIEDQTYEEESLTAGKTELFYSTKKDEGGNIKTVIPGISNEYFEKLEIIKGELLINTKDKREIEIAQSMGIEVNPYDITEDGELLSSNGNLLLMDSNGTLTIPDRVTKIGEGAFANLEGLKTIIIPGTVEEIAASAFAHNKTLETVIMKDGVKVIGVCAFEQCAQLKTVEMPDSIETIGSQAFYSCPNLTDIEIPPNITMIPSYLFCNCSSLKTINLPEGITDIGSTSFKSTSITNIKIPSSVTNINSNAFEDCKKLETIDLTGNRSYVFEDNMIKNIEKTEIVFITYPYINSSDTLTIPEGIKTFGFNLEQYENLKKIIFPSTLEKITTKYPYTIENIELKNNSNYISENGFFYTNDTNKSLILCYSKDKNIKVPDSITNLKEYSFISATNAEIIELPDNLTTIDAFTFTNTSINLDEIKIGKNVSLIDPLFKYMHYHGKVTIDSQNQNYTIENNILYNKDKTTLIAVLEQIQGSFTIPEQVTTIGGRAFHNQYTMKEVIISEKVTDIGNSFNYCTGLTKVEIPRNVEKIGESCFNQCSNLKEIIVQKEENSIVGAPWSATAGEKVVYWKEN